MIQGQVLVFWDRNSWVREWCRVPISSQSPPPTHWYSPVTEYWYVRVKTSRRQDEPSELKVVKTFNIHWLSARDYIKNKDSLLYLLGTWMRKDSWVGYLRLICTWLPIHDYHWLYEQYKPEIEILRTVETPTSLSFEKMASFSNSELIPSWKCTVFDHHHWRRIQWDSCQSTKAQRSM